MDDLETSHWAWNAGIVVVGVALFQGGVRVGKAWPLRRHEHRLPSVEEIRVLLDEIRTALPGPAVKYETYVRGKARAMVEGGGILPTIERELEYVVHDAILAGCRLYIIAFSARPQIPGQAPDLG